MGLATNAAFASDPGVATYIARRPEGECLMNGPPAGSAVACGCGLPATVPVTAMLWAPLEDVQRDLSRGAGGFASAGVQVLGRPDTGHAHHGPQQDDGHDDQFHSAARRHASSRPETRPLAPPRAR